MKEISCLLIWFWWESFSGILLIALSHLYQHLYASIPNTHNNTVCSVYGTIPVLSKTVDCYNGYGDHASIYLSKVLEENNEMKASSHPPNDHNLVLPNSHANSSYFDAMKQGVLVKSQNGSVYMTPLCRTMDYCSKSPFCPTQEGKCDLVFDYNSHFRPALEHYALVPGESPSLFHSESRAEVGFWSPRVCVPSTSHALKPTHEFETISFSISVKGFTHQQARSSSKSYEANCYKLLSTPMYPICNSL